MNDFNELIIRHATEANRAFALSLVPRLRSFGEVPLRTAEDLDAAEQRTLEQVFDELPAGAIWSARRASGRRCRATRCFEPS
jgi:hypothetical protein